MSNTYRLEVDLKKSVTGVTPTFVQFDTARIEFQIFDNGKLFDISPYTSVEFAHQKPSGSSLIADGLIETDSKGNKIIVYNYQGSEMSEIGFVETSFSLLGSNNKKISIQPFNVKIRTDLREEAFDIASPEFGKLQNYIVQLEKIKVDMTAATTKANTAAGRVDTVITQANTAIGTMNTLKTDTTKVKDDTLIVKNETIAVRDATNTAKNTAIQVKDDTLTVKNATDLVRQSTVAVKDATETVRVNTEAVRVATDKVKNDTQTIGTNTEALRVSVVQENANLQTLKSDTLTVKNDTLKVKNDTTTVKNEAASVITETRAVKDATDLVRVNSLAALELTKTATTNANAATDRAALVADNTYHLGAYSASVQYKKNNTVSLNGSSYMAIQNTLGNSPTNTTFWRLLAQKGVDGTGSVSKVNGISPDTNGNIDLILVHKNTSPPVNTQSLWIDLSN